MGKSHLKTGGEIVRRTILRAKSSAGAGGLGVKTVLAKHPLITNCVTYGLLYSGSEFLQQTIIRNISTGDSPDYDFGNIARFWVIGTFVFPVTLFHWYKWLDARFVGAAAKTIVQKMLLDQFVISPPILVTFYVLMSIMERRDDIFTECREKLIPTFQSSCLFWMPAQALNFLVVPPGLRVVYVGTCSLLWVNILCVLKRGKEEEKK